MPHIPTMVLCHKRAMADVLMYGHGVAGCVLIESVICARLHCNGVCIELL